MLFASKAIGGPLDGVRLEAQLNWNGVVRKPKLPHSYYDGRYLWTQQGWTWKAEQIERQGRSSSRGRNVLQRHSDGSISGR